MTEWGPGYMGGRGPFRFPGAGGFRLGRAGSPPYKRPAMTRKQIDVSVYIFLILLIAFFCYAVWGVLGMVGVHG